MAQIKNKFLADDAVSTAKLQDGSISTVKLAADAATGAKIRLDNAEFLRARNAANSADINILQVDGSDIIQFASVPRVAADASNGNELVRKSQLDALLEGLKPKEAVRAASTANVAIATDLENGDTLDGVTLATGDRVLLKDQSTASENGIYIVAATGAASRATDFDEVSPIDEINGAYTFVQEGTANAGKGYVQTGSVATVGTDAISFVFFNSASTLTGGDGIDITSDVVSVDLADASLEFATNQLKVKTKTTADGVLQANALALNGTGGLYIKVDPAAGIEGGNQGTSGVESLRISAQAAGNGLTGGGGSALAVQADATGGANLATAINISSNGVAISIDDSSIGENVSNQLEVKDSGISTAKIADDAVTAAKLAADTAGLGLTQAVGGELDVNVDDSTVEISTDTLQVKDLGISTAKLAATSVTAAKLGSDVAGNGLTGGNGSAIAAQANVTEVSTTLASAIDVSSSGLAISVDDSTIEGSGQGVAGAENLRVKDLGISTAKLAATSVTAAKLGSDVAGNGLTGGNGSAIAAQAGDSGAANLANVISVESQGLSVKVDEVTIQENGSGQLESVKQEAEEIVLDGTDITNQYIDLAQAARSASSIMLFAGGLLQDRGTDYTVSLTGGVGGVTRLTFAGDLATSGAAELESGDLVQVSYEYL